MLNPRHLIRLDGTAGLVAGVVVLALHGWLAELYQLPRWLLISNGCANLIYGTYSSILAARTHRPLLAITILAFANMIWAVVCIVVVATFANSATLFGLGHFTLEALFVGGLGALEWRYRDLLRSGVRAQSIRKVETQSPVAK